MAQTLAVPASVAQTTFTNADGTGNWLAYGNWSDGLPVSYVSYGSAYIDAGTAVVTGSGAVAYIVTVGYSGTAGLTVTGTLNTQDSGLGKMGNAVGTALVDGGAWLSSGWRKVGGDNDTPGNVGGEGHLTVSNGGTISNSTAWVGFGVGSVGTAVITGLNSTWTSSEILHVGVDGNGTLTIEDHAKVTSTLGGSIGTLADGVGMVTVTGSGSRWDTSSLLVGNKGQGTLVIADGGQVSVSSGYVGNSTVNLGAVTISGPGSLWTSTDRMDIGNGSVTIRNGGKASNALSGIGGIAGAEATVTVTGTGSQWVTGNGLAVGLSGTGSLIVEAGGSASSRYTVVAEQLGTVGSVLVSGAGSVFSNTDQLYVGRDGSATIRVENGGLLKNGDGIVGESSGNGTVTVTGAGSRWVSTGSLTIGQQGTGLVEVADGGFVSASGPIRIGNGSFNIGAVRSAPAAAPGAVAASAVIFQGWSNSALVFNHTGNAYAFDAPMSGTGSILQLAGTTVLGGDSSGFTGTTSVSGGVLRVNGHLGGSVTVSGGSLGGSGTLLGNVSVGSGGTIAPGGTLTVAGNLDLVSGSALRIGVNGDGRGDRIDVGGQLTANGSKLYLTSTGGQFAGPTSYAVLATGAGISGSGFDTVSDLYFLDSRLAQVGDDLVLTLQRNARGMADLPQTPNQASVANALNTLGPGNAVFDSMLMMSEDQARRTLDAVSGASHTATQQVIDQTFGMFADTLANRSSGAPGGTTAPLGYVEATVASSAVSAIAQAAQAPQTSRSFWLAPVAGTGSIDANGGAPSANWSSGGLTGGYEYRTTLSSGDVLAGLAVGWQRTAADTSSSSLNAQSGMVAAYGRFDTDTVALSGTLYAGVSRAEGKRRIVAPGIDLLAGSDYWTQAAGISAEIAYAMPLTEGVTLSPLAGLSAGISHRDAFTENGAGAFNLASEGQNQGLLDPALGLEMAYELPVADGTLTTRLRTVWRHALLDAPGSNMRLDGTGAAFAIEGREPARDKLVIDAGLNYATGTLDFFADYQGLFSANERQHSVRLGAKAAF